MSKAKDFKRAADGALEDFFRAMFEEIDIEKLRKEIDAMRGDEPDYTPAEHARALTRRTAIRCAAAGAVTGLPSGLVALGTIGVDLAYLMYQQFRLILGIATIYGHEPTKDERFSEALSCLAFSGGAGIGKQGMHVIRERMLKTVPLVGAVSGGALNYAAVYAVARSAVRYYETRVDPALADEIWNEGDREHA